jgi:hypothetical protein
MISIYMAFRSPSAPYDAVAVAVGKLPVRDHNLWKRVYNEGPGEIVGSIAREDLPRRAAAEEETRRDLRKPIQQLICDVHEGAMDQSLSDEERFRWALRRMVSMMGRVALEHEYLSKQIVLLTWVIVGLTVLVVVLGGATLYLDITKHP